MAEVTAPISAAAAAAAARISSIVVPARGPEDSPFVIVGEAPGKEEIKKRMPFVGPSGVVLQAALDQFPAGSFPEPYITNVVPHLITGVKDMAVLQQLVAKNRQRVLEEIAKHPRKVILGLGNAAMWALTGDYNMKITRVRGKLFSSSLANQGIVASTHPAYLLRGSGSLRQFKADIAYAINLANGGSPHTFIPPTWEYVDTLEKAQEFVQRVKDHKGDIAGDLETGGFSHRLDKVLMGGFTLDGKHVYIIPGTKAEYIKAGLPDIFAHIGEMWSTDAQFVWHNGKFDIKFLRHQYRQPARVDHDTMLLSYSLDETRGIHDLETVAADWLGSPNWKGELDAHKKKNQSYDVIPEPILTQYMAYDIVNTYNLKRVLYPLVLNDPASSLLYHKTLIPGSEYLAQIESAGMFVDLKRVEENRIEMQAEADKLREALNQQSIEAGYGPINPNSPIQLCSFLYNTLKLSTKTRATDARTLESLPAHPAVSILQNYRKVNKGLTTYVTPVTDHLQDDGRVHQSYLIHGTATGRLACRDPNLQNIPRDPKLRGQFIPRPGYCFIEVDLNQAELRSLAALSGDPELVRIYTDPTSKGLHEEVRAEIFGYPKDWTPEQLDRFYKRWYTTELKRVLEEQKMRAKNTNFGIIYGITPPGLAEQIEGTTQEAARMLDVWAKKFPIAWSFIERCRAAPLRGQNLKTVFGHKKRFGVVTPEILVTLQNESANFPHQSTAATITLHGGMLIQTELKTTYDTDIVNTVHDSIIMEVPLKLDYIIASTQLAINALERVPVDWGITRVPFKAEAKGGMRWGNLKDFNEFISDDSILELMVA